MIITLFLTPLLIFLLTLLLPIITYYLITRVKVTKNLLLTKIYNLAVEYLLYFTFRS